MVSTTPRFLDAAGGLPISASAQEFLTAGLARAWASPSGRYGAANRSRAVLHQARAVAAASLGCRPDEVFAGPPPDLALDLVLRSLAEARPGRPVAVSAVERVAILRVGDDLSAAGGSVVEVPVDGGGALVVAGLPAGTGVAAVQAANRETGVRQDLGLVRAGLPEDALLLVDATATRCREDVPTDWDAIVLDPRQWGGPAGLTLVGVRTRCGLSTRQLERLYGDPAVALLAAATASWPTAEEPRIAELAERLRRGLVDRVGDVELVGGGDRLAHIVNASLLYVGAEELVDDLAAAGFAIHSGSACTSDTRRPSHVLTAMGVLTGGNIRVSLPPECPEQDVTDLLVDMERLVGEQRKAAGV